MENNERDRRLDQWLDEALSKYSAAEPRFGLEQRVLSRIRGDEQSRARRWNFWRWMPAFGAIAAVVVIAVAVRPTLEKHAPSRQVNARPDTFSVPQEQKSRPADNNADTRANETGQKHEVSHLPGVADAAHRNATAQRQPTLAPRGIARDGLVTSESAAQTGRPVSAQSEPKRSSAQTREPAIDLAESANELSAPPPPPPPPSQAAAAERALKQPAPMTAQSVPVSPDGGVKPAEQTAQIQTAPNLIADKKLALQSLATVLSKDARRSEAQAKPDSGNGDTDAMNIFGVRVRVNNGLTASQQFPAPAPLSKQEKLALAAGQQLTDSAVAQHKSVEIPPIEIKDVEIKPLEGPGKEK